MIGKTPDYIEVIRPLSGGVISDDRMTQYMIREFILQVTGHRLTKPRIIICVPSFITDVEKRAVVEAAMSAGSRKAYLIDEPIAALIGAGVNIGKARGNMVVDIGGGTNRRCHRLHERHRHLPLRPCRPETPWTRRSSGICRPSTSCSSANALPSG